MSTLDEYDQQYLDLIIQKITVSGRYTPKFGKGKSTSLSQFQDLYGSDSFYTWMGLNTSMVYAAHKAAGGITSLYRQIGIRCEILFRRIICDQLGLSIEQATWSYTTSTSTRPNRTLSLDAKINLADLKNESQHHTTRSWLRLASQQIGVDREIAAALKGCVFEVRQGYKSKDSKRQNADIANAGAAYSQGYLPIVVMLSDQIDSDVAVRYVGAKWLLLRGQVGGSPTSSTYTFCSEILGYDLSAFFQRHSQILTETVVSILHHLLQPEDNSIDNSISTEEYPEDHDIEN
jgi:hypothetical protein